MSLKLHSQAKRLNNPPIISQINMKLNYANNLNKFKKDIFSTRKSPYPKALTPSHHGIKKIFLSKEKNFLPSKSPQFLNKKTLILDLDETLVHSNFDPFPRNDIILNINFDGYFYKIYVLVRPGAEEFIKTISNYYELVIFTASLSTYASPLLDILDKERNIQYRLYREKCTFLNGTYVKQLKKIGRNLKDIVIVDNSPLAYSFDTDNGLPISSWYEDKNDKELYDIIPILKFLSQKKDVRNYIKKFVHFDKIDYSLAYKLINEEENIENEIKKNQLNEDLNINNFDESMKNLKIQIEDKNIINNNESLKDKNIFNKNNKNIFNKEKNKKADIIDNNLIPLKLINILSSKKENIPLIFNNNIKRIKSPENKLPLYQNINLKNLELNESKINNNENSKKPNKLKLLNNRLNNSISNNNLKEKAKNKQLFLNLTQRNFKDKILSKKKNFKASNKKKLTLGKDLTLGNSNTYKNIFSKDKKSINNNFLSNFNLYKTNKNKSNINIFSYNNDKNISTNKNNNLSTLNQNTYNFNLKYKDLLINYNNNLNSLNKKNIKNNYLNFRNKAIIFANFKPNVKKRISSSITNKEILNLKNKLNQKCFSQNNIKSRSSVNFYKTNKHENKNNTENNFVQ